MIIRSSAYTRDAMLTALAERVDAATGPGTISIYGGEQPASADEAPGDRPLLARLSFAKPAFGRPARGAIGARPISENEAIAAGKPTWARISDGDGNAVVALDVGEDGKPLNLSTVTFERGGRIEILSLVLRMPAA